MTSKELSEYYQEAFEPLISSVSKQDVLKDLSSDVGELVRAFTNEDIKGFESCASVVAKKAELDAMRASNAAPNLLIAKSTDLKNEKAKIALERQEIFRHFSCADSCVELASAVALFGGNSKTARQIATIGGASVSIARKVAGLVESGFTGATIAGPIGSCVSIATSLISIISALDDDEGDNAFNAILDAIKQTYQLIEEVRKEMHQRFDIIEDKLDGIQNDIKQNFAALDVKVIELQRSIDLYSKSNTEMHLQTQTDVRQLRDIMMSVRNEIKDESAQRQLDKIIDEVSSYINRLGVFEKSLLLDKIEKFTTHLKSTSFSSLLTGDVSKLSDATLSELPLDEKSADNAGFHINSLLGYLKKEGFFKDIDILPNPTAWSYPAAALVNLFFSIYNTKDSIVSEEEYSLMLSMKQQSEALNKFFIALKNPEIVNNLIGKYRADLITLNQSLKKFTEVKVSEEVVNLNQKLSARLRHKALTDLAKMRANNITYHTDYKGWYSEYEFSSVTGFMSRVIALHVAGESPYKQSSPVVKRKEYIDALQEQAKKVSIKMEEVINNEVLFSEIKIFDLYTNENITKERKRFFISPINISDPILPCLSNLDKLLKIPQIILTAEFLGVADIEYKYKIQDDMMILQCYYIESGASVLVSEGSFKFNRKYFKGNEGIWLNWVENYHCLNENTLEIFDYKHSHQLGDYWVSTRINCPKLERHDGVMNHLGQIELKINSILNIENALIIKRKCNRAIKELNLIKSTELSLTQANHELYSLSQAYSASYNILHLYVMLSFHDDYIASDKMLNYFMGSNAWPNSLPQILQYLNNLEKEQNAKSPLSICTLLDRLNLEILPELQRMLISKAQSEKTVTNYKLIDRIFSVINYQVNLYKNKVQKSSILVTSKEDALKSSDADYEQGYKEAMEILGMLGTVFSHMGPEVQQAMINDLKKQFEAKGKSSKAFENFERLMLEQKKESSDKKVEVIDDTSNVVLMQHQYQKKQIGERAITGWVLKDVPDDGNCFFYSAIEQMKKVNHDFCIDDKTIPLHQKLRNITAPGTVDKQWADIDVKDNLARLLNVVIAVVDTRAEGENPHEYYYTYYDNTGERHEGFNLSDLPADKPVVKLAYTGNHYLSVEQDVANQARSKVTM